MPKRANSSSQRGFTLIELMVAVLILMTGVVAVAQLVPAAMRLNLENRYDSTSTVMAQRMMEILAAQPLNNFGPLSVDLFQPAQTAIANPPGLSTIPNVVLGSSVAPALAAPICGPTVASWGPTALYVTPMNTINWTSAAVNGYSAQVIDPTDPTQAVYEVRWAVATSWGLVPCVASGAATPIMKRIVVSVRRRDPATASRMLPPANLTIIRTNGVM